MIQSTPLPVGDRRRPRAARPLAFPSGDKLFCKPLDQTCRASQSPSPSRVRVERSSSARCLSAKKAKARGRAKRRTGDPAGSLRRERATRAQVSASRSAATRRAPSPVPCVPSQLSQRLTRSPSCRAGAASTWCPSAARTPRLLAVPPVPSRSACAVLPGSAPGPRIGRGAQTRIAAPIAGSLLAARALRPEGFAWAPSAL